MTAKGSRFFLGKVAVVNGGTRGIGREIALQLAAAGAKVVITGRTKHQGEKTLAQLDSKGSGDAMYVQMDATKETEIVTLHEKVVAAFGGFDFAVNNLGVEDTPLSTIDESTEETFDRCVSIKAKSAFLGMKHQIIHFKKNQKPGAIVNVSSMIGLGGHAMVPAYTAANGAVQSLTKSVAIEVAEIGIRVNCVCPGAVDDSPMLHRFTGGSDGSGAPDDKIIEGAGYEGYINQATTVYPMRRLPTVGEVAGAVMFLLSPSANAITGHLLPVDGGFVVNLSR